MSSQRIEQTIFVVDDDAAICDGIVMLMETVGLAAESFSAAADFLSQYDGRPGVLVLDVRMPGMSGLEAHAQMTTERFDNLAVIFVSGHGDIAMAVASLKSGAADFLTKPFRDQDLIDCIQRTLAANQKRIQSARQRRDIEERIATLTPREREVMHHIALGKPNKIVGLDLGISQRTVEIHRSQVMRKMGSYSLAHLVHTLDKINFFEPATDAPVDPKAPVKPPAFAQTFSARD